MSDTPRPRREDPPETAALPLEAVQAPPIPPAERRRAQILTAAFYAAVFTAVGAHLPFWPVWLAAWGLDEATIGYYLGAGLMVRIVANAAFAAIADRFAVRRLMLALMGFAAALVFLAHLVVESHVMLLVLTLLCTATLSPMMPLGEALGLRAARMHGFLYPTVRAAGSVAFLLANLAVGWAIGQTGPDAALWTLVGACLVAALLGLAHPGGGAPAGAAGSDTARLREGLALFQQRHLAVFALAAAAAQAAHASFYLLGSLEFTRMGLSPGIIGALWATGVIAETLLMLGPGRDWVTRLGPAQALALGAAVGIVRWGAMALYPPAWSLWLLQALHAFTFALVHLATMAFVARHLELRLQASGQGVLLGLSAGIAMAVATLAAGWLHELMPAAAWLMAAGLSAVAVVAAWLVARPDRPGRACATDQA
ncbi:MAG: MFS transporter [Pseudomonadota bacterium]